jgi:hypothetical protein
VGLLGTGVLLHYGSLAYLMFDLSGTMPADARTAIMMAGRTLGTIGSLLSAAAAVGLVARATTLPWRLAAGLGGLGCAVHGGIIFVFLDESAAQIPVESVVGIALLFLAQGGLSITAAATAWARRRVAIVLLSCAGLIQIILISWQIGLAQRGAWVGSWYWVVHEDGVTALTWVFVLSLLQFTSPVVRQLPLAPTAPAA